MSEPYRDPARGPYVRERSNTTGWTLGILAILLLIGLAYWSMNHNSGATNAANTPPVTATPGAVPARTAAPPQETTGQATTPAR